MCVYVCVCVCVCVRGWVCKRMIKGTTNSPSDSDEGIIRSVRIYVYYLYDDGTVCLVRLPEEVLEWCHSGVTMVLHWCYNGVTMVLQ
jgi:hypothetical protein